MLYLIPTFIGSYDHQVTPIAFESVLEGWVFIPPELEAQAKSLLPFAKLTIVDGTVTNAEHNAETLAAWEAWKAEEAAKIPPTPEPTIEERTTALEATQSDVIDVLASALGVTI